MGDDRQDGVAQRIGHHDRHQGSPIERAVRTKSLPSDNQHRYRVMRGRGSN